MNREKVRVHHSHDGQVVTHFLYETDLPDAEGWWARKRDGRTDWFRVDRCDFGDPGEPNLAFAIYVGDIIEMIRVEEFTTPLTRWFGPVVLQNDDG